MKSIALLSLLVLSSTAFADVSCRDLGKDEKLEFKAHVCQKIQILNRSEKIDLNRCVTKAVFNICEETRNGFTSKYMEVDYVYNSAGYPFACTMNIYRNDEIDRLDCNGNY